MDSPSSGLPQPTMLSPPAYEPGTVLETVATKEPAPRTDALFVASFGNAVAVDYAAFVSQRSRGEVTVVGDEVVGRLVEPPVRSLSMNELIGSTPHFGGEHRDGPSMVLFLPPRLTKRARSAGRTARYRGDAAPRFCRRRQLVSRASRRSRRRSG